METIALRQLPINPTSKKWVNENIKTSSASCAPLFATTVTNQKVCCVENCRSVASIRNFRCLKGLWKMKQNCFHHKICIYHYNSDLKQYPRQKRIRDMNPNNVVVISKKKKKPKKKPKKKKNITGKKRKRAASNYDDDDFVVYEDEMDYDPYYSNTPSKTIASTRKRRNKKRKINHGYGYHFEETGTNIFNSDDKCCIKGCNDTASIRNYDSLRGNNWQIKRNNRRSNKLKICNNHYLTDLRKYPRGNDSRKKTEGDYEDSSKLLLLLVASFFV